MDLKQRKPRGKRWAVYKRTKGGHKGVGLAVVVLNSLEDAQTAADIFFQDICEYGVIVCAAPKGFNSGGRPKKATSL